VDAGGAELARYVLASGADDGLLDPVIEMVRAAAGVGAVATPAPCETGV
jgi:hypothetical protein